MFIQWTDAYKLGIPSVDTEHKRLADLVNRFFIQLQDGAEAPALAMILNDLIEETIAHFQHEEEMLDHCNYPSLAQHKAEHDRLLLQLGHFRTAYLKGEETPRELTIDTVEFFRHWLLAHILREDMLYKPHAMRIS